MRLWCRNGLTDDVHLNALLRYEPTNGEIRECNAFALEQFQDVVHEMMFW